MADPTDREWSVGHDGPSLAMIISPSGRIFSIQELGVRGKQWGNADDNDALVQQIVDGLNCRLPKQIIDIVATTMDAHKKSFSWYCGCGHTNGINLASCACCGRDPNGNYRGQSTP